MKKKQISAWKTRWMFAYSVTVPPWSEPVQSDDSHFHEQFTRELSCTNLTVYCLLGISWKKMNYVNAKVDDSFLVQRVEDCRLRRAGYRLLYGKLARHNNETTYPYFQTKT